MGQRGHAHSRRAPHSESRRPIRSDQGNADLLVNLTRLHAYTFARKTDTAWQTRDGLYAPEPYTDLPAAEVADSVNPQQRTEAERHLERAIDRYRQALKIDGRHLIGRLGLAWCLEQAGQTAAAISE